jgi:hypothetical protein
MATKLLPQKAFLPEPPLPFSPPRLFPGLPAFPLLPDSLLFPLLPDSPAFPPAFPLLPDSLLFPLLPDSSAFPLLPDLPLFLN